MAGSFSVENLNPEQREAVLTLNGPVLILAGAGTGKTRTVTCRIAHMVEQGINPAGILALTFTNKAANEMCGRVAGMVSSRAVRSMTVCTFHSLCVRILRQDIGLLGYKENFSIYTGSDQSGLLRRLIMQYGAGKEKLEPNAVLSALSRVRNHGGTADDIGDSLVASVARAYQQSIRAQNAVDFDDLLVLAERLLREHEDVREKWRKRFTRITVDEFQDTNSLQMSLLRQLVGPGRHVCVVGDDDQSIYGWRGADVSNILEFERYFPNPKIIKLEENYRCTRQVLELANAVIAHNVGRREKTLRTGKIGKEPVRLVSLPGADEEAGFIADEIEERRLLHKTPWEDFAILFRANTQSRRLEIMLRERRIPYRMVGARSFFDRREVKDLVGYLQVMDNPGADLPLLRILNTPPRGISGVTSSMAIEWSREHGKSVWATLCDLSFRAEFSARTQNAIAAFVELMEKYGAVFAESQRNFAETLQELMKEIGYDEFLSRNCKTDMERDRRLRAVDDVIAALRSFWRPGLRLTDFLVQISLDQEKDEDDIEHKSGVCLVTVHAAKGLEFQNVYLVGVEEGILPHKRALEEGGVDEERRLLYVGITRARERLTMTYCSRRVIYGEPHVCEPSSFLGEVSSDLFEKIDYEEMMHKEVEADEAVSFFDSLRSLLDE